jgi:hypothetical protein
VSWSYELLGEAQRRLLARLSVLRGGFDLEVAERVEAGQFLTTAAGTPSEAAPGIQARVMIGAAWSAFHLGDNLRAAPAVQIGQICTQCLMQKFALCKEPAVVADRSPAPIARAGPKGLHSRAGFA